MRFTHDSIECYRKLKALLPQSKLLYSWLIRQSRFYVFMSEVANAGFCVVKYEASRHDDVDSQKSIRNNVKKIRKNSEVRLVQRPFEAINLKSQAIGLDDLENKYSIKM